MLKYTTLDIIKRAEQLADLENSDFISDEEKSFLLNESWVQLYQKSINANEKAWIKRITVCEGDELPKDFYQLSAIVTQSGERIPKKNPNDVYGYEIINNRIHFTKPMMTFICYLEYFPIPQTLYFSSNKKERVDFDDSPKIMINEDFYLNQSNKIKSIETNEELKTITQNGLKLKNGILNKRSFYDWNEEVVETRTKPFVIKGNRITFDDVENSDLNEFIAYITDESESVGYFIDTNYKIYRKDKTQTEYSLSENSLIFCRQDGLYFTLPESNKITRLSETVEHFNLELSKFCSFVDSHSCIVKTFDKYSKVSYGFNTLLDYPNNFYFTMLAYMLAIAFKSKQQGDVTLLTDKTQEIASQFFESLSQDANEQYRIKNVYQNRGRVW